MQLPEFTTTTRTWFERTFDRPTTAQLKAWPVIATGAHTLISAPTGSGKTLAALLWSLDRIAAAGPLPDDRRGVRIVYISPLKALSYDIERNLIAPLRGIGAPITTAIRTGDTSQRERERMRRNPPDILITTPESLYLILISRARAMLATVETVIVDEIHAVASSKRGAHLALTLERLHALADAPEPQRIGLSATQNPLAEIGRFLVGPTRSCEIVDAGVRTPLDLQIVVPVESMTEPEAVGGPAVDPLEQTDVHLHVAGSESTRHSIWSAIYPQILAFVRAHRSTIVFVNSRRSAERLALRLNELADAETGGRPQTTSGDPIARAHHGSLSREERLLVEEDLKAGRIPCLVATSSLELGIDMGAVDLVLQIESPKSVARGLQRVGRAGHTVGATSKGRIFPKFRADLLECTVVAQRMREGAIEATVIPRNPLDVLCQQIVAIVCEHAAADEAEGSDTTLTVDGLYALITATYSFADLPRKLLENVLDMLDGRYPSHEFGELKPRINWDRITGTLRPLKAARMLAITNVGTIPDRGLYAVVLPDGRRVGELDEEMVYEARPGLIFLLGASSWRIEQIERDRVIVTPAPGRPGAVPFWRGDSVGRPKQLGEAIGRFSRQAVDLEPEVLAQSHGLDRLAARNLVDFLREQRQATGVLPSDETIVVERFRDEIGDWRLCILSPFGGRVNAAWGLALSAAIRDELGLEADVIWADDGIITHLPEVDDFSIGRIVDLIMIDPAELERLLVAELADSALFGARFRENAGRALLIPRAYPGRRTPLWQQRLKAQSLLEVARRYSDFPIVLETYRECMQDVLDLPGLTSLLESLHSDAIKLVEVETPTASPIASSLLFDYVATYMYEGDTPNAERRAAALSLDRDLLAELLGQEELRELIDPGAMQRLEDDLQHRSERTQAHDRDDLADILRRVGDLSEVELAARAATPQAVADWLDRLSGERRAIAVRVGGERRWIAAADAGLYRDALGVALPAGLPTEFLADVADAAERLVARYAHTHAPFAAERLRERYGIDLAATLKAHESDGRLVRGALRPDNSSGEFEWCDPEVLRRLRRASLAVLRKEIEATDRRTLGAFLPSWQGIDARTSGRDGVDRLRQQLAPLQGLALPAQVWERDVLPRRCNGYSPTWLDQLCAAGEIVWIGGGALGRGTGRVALYFRDDVSVLGPPWSKGTIAGSPSGPIHAALRTRLTASPQFFAELLSDDDLIGIATPAELQEALWDLVWAGEVTNDAFAPLRAPRRSLIDTRLTAPRAGVGRRRTGTRFSRRSRVGINAPQPLQGRWASTAPLLQPTGPVMASERSRAIAELLLERYGLLTREQVIAEGLPGGFSGLYDVLCDLETLGVCRRGYFVEGLGGAQFGLTEAVERLRTIASNVDRSPPIVIAATDPAQPYGTVLPWPSRAADDARARPARRAGAYLVLVAAEPVLYIEHGGHGLQVLTADHNLAPDYDHPQIEPAIGALTEFIVGDRSKRLTIERIDGAAATSSPLLEKLIAHGFRQGPRKLTLRA